MCFKLSDGGGTFYIYEALVEDIVTVKVKR
jgi:hypothetical protein